MTRTPQTKMQSVQGQSTQPPTDGEAAALQQVRPEDDAREIIAIWRQFAVLFNTLNSPQWHSLPFTSHALAPDEEMAGLVASILWEVGRKLDHDDFVRAGDYPLWYSSEGVDFGDLPQPATEAEFNELHRRIIARLRAAAWEGNRLLALGAWIDENVDVGMQVCVALRMLLKYSKDSGRSQRG